MMPRSPPAICSAMSLGDDRLAGVILAAVAVAGVDHQPTRQAGLLHRRERRLDVVRVVVRAATCRRAG